MPPAKYVERAKVQSPPFSSDPEWERRLIEEVPKILYRQWSRTLAICGIEWEDASQHVVMELIKASWSKKSQWQPERGRGWASWVRLVADSRCKNLMERSRAGRRVGSAGAAQSLDEVLDEGGSLHDTIPAPEGRLDGYRATLIDALEAAAREATPGTQEHAGLTDSLRWVQGADDAEIAEAIDEVGTLGPTVARDLLQGCIVLGKYNGAEAVKARRAQTCKDAVTAAAWEAEIATKAEQRLEAKAGAEAAERAEKAEKATQTCPPAVRKRVADAMIRKAKVRGRDLEWAEVIEAMQAVPYDTNLPRWQDALLVHLGLPVDKPSRAMLLQPSLVDLVVLRASRAGVVCGRKHVEEAAAKLWANSTPPASRADRARALTEALGVRLRAKPS